ncbi:CpaF family protein [Ochrobactrum sp. Marseille-Q0166]|nr:CpaF family protein [Ochrobactrum sp. Marseille-Q0166]
MRNELICKAIRFIQIGKRSNNEEGRIELRSSIKDIIERERFALSSAEQIKIINDICDDILGFGPLEELLQRDDVSDIMVNGSQSVFIEVGGQVQRTNVKFRHEDELHNICQKIVSNVGRRVDDSSPICDARLADGSRVNVIVPPLAIDGTILTIRKFRKDSITLDKLQSYGTISPNGANLLKLISAARCNIIVSGGTGSGKTTLLNCLASYISPSERIITCEDAAELQLQQPHVVRLESRPMNSEAKGEVSMRDLVRNSLRMRPDRIVVGEVRGPEVMDLLQAMNTGHAGSMGTIHSNSPRECLSRIETLIAIGGYQLPQKTIRDIIVSAVDIVIQVSRLQDGSRKITHISEVVGMEGETIVTQNLLEFYVESVTKDGLICGKHKGTGISRPAFFHKAAALGLDDEVRNVLNQLNSD